VALPSQPGGCDPLEHLPASLGKQLTSVSTTLPRKEWGTIPKPCHRITKENEKLLIKKIISINMGSLIPVREILKKLYPEPENRRRALRWFRQRGLDATLAGGWFSVAHKELFDRLIFDRRPANATESRLGWAQLPHGSLLTQVVLRGSRCLRGSLHDLRVFFFCLAQPEEHVHKNAVGRIWGGKRLSRSRFGPL
jgi:hypothetical protein